MKNGLFDTMSDDKFAGVILYGLFEKAVRENRIPDESDPAFLEVLHLAGIAPYSKGAKSIALFCAGVTAALEMDKNVDAATREKLADTHAPCSSVAREGVTVNGR